MHCEWVRQWRTRYSRLSSAILGNHASGTFGLWSGKLGHVKWRGERDGSARSEICAWAAWTMLSCLPQPSIYYYIVFGLKLQHGRLFQMKLNSAQINRFCPSSPADRQEWVHILEDCVINENTGGSGMFNVQSSEFSSPYTSQNSSLHSSNCIPGVFTG